MKFPLLFKRATVIVLFIMLHFSITVVRGQSSAGTTIIEKMNNYNEKFPEERLYLHFDKPYYAAGDTIWFKGYIVNSAILYSPLSSRVYIDLINDSNRVVKHFIFPASLGLTIGNIYLDEKLVHEGTYTIRAYTNWMRNFSADNYFYNHFYVAGNNIPWLISLTPALSTNHLKIDLKYTTLKKREAAARNVQVRLINDKKTLGQNDAQVLPDGLLSLNFDLPDNLPAKNLTLITQDKKENTTTAIPILVSRVSDVDIQFMPESGPLIETLPSHIGFKAIGEDGRGVNIKGVVYDKENHAEAKFETLHNGMGAFDLVPQQGESYTAKVTLPSGEVKTVNLPSAKSSGTVLKIKNNPASDSLDVSILATKDMQGSEYTIVGESGRSICYAAAFKLTKDYLNLHVPKSKFPTGVAHFTLVNLQNQPINDRICFINHKDNLKLEINTGGRSFTSRDSIPLQINVKDEKGNPVVGSFSLAVTDDKQIKNAGLYSENIFTRLLLSSEIKGYIEDPAFYFTDTNDAANALDVLLLTQGWIAYNWNDVLNVSSHPVYAAEPEFMIKGKVSNLLNKPIANANITLLALGKYKMFKDTSTDAEGKFVFKKFPLMDSVAFVLQARKAKGRIINAGISVDENNSLPPVVLPAYPSIIPWYASSDSTMLNYVKISNNYHDELNTVKYGGGNHLLKTVDIKDKAIVKNSQNLNGAGNYDQAITQDEIEKAGKISLLELIEKRVAGFHEGYVHKDNNLTFIVKDKRTRFVIDGIDIDRFYESTSGVPNEHYYYQKEILNYLSAEDIIGIEVIYSSKYSTLYNSKNLTTEEQLAISRSGPSGSDIAYLEITTRSGNGPFTKAATGIYVYKPATVSIAAQFYRPKYQVKTTSPGFTDLRSTIHWEPNIITNKSGQATTFFYAADPAATYTIILQGTNLNGKVGYTTQKITITPKP
ncbi:MAG: hypothetical protein JWQ79_3122 [Mucilaginibacter sp.]|nr:hypothetical protein [Mucilaginibacter sp.]